jgi:hypothetical protein
MASKNIFHPDHGHVEHLKTSKDGESVKIRYRDRGDIVTRWASSSELPIPKKEES